MFVWNKPIQESDFFEIVKFNFVSDIEISEKESKCEKIDKIKLKNIWSSEILVMHDLRFKLKMEKPIN